MSFGIATFPLDGEDPGELMCSVDRALYGAKADGGDCSVVCSQGAELNGSVPAGVRARSAPARS